MPGKYDEEQAEATEKNRYGLADMSKTPSMARHVATFFEASRGSSRSTQLAVAYGESPISWLRGSLQTMCLSARGHGDGDSGEDHH